MGIRAVAIWALLAGCSDSTVVLDVDVASTGATEVELVIAEQPLDGKTVQGPPGTLPNQVVWTRDSATRTTAAAVRGHAKFHIVAGDQNAAPTIIAVGFAGEVAKGFVVVPALPVDRPGIYTATLALATPSSAAGTGPHLDVWAAGQTVRTGPVCISIPGTRAIVPADDPDCDGFVAPNECPGGDFVFRDMQPATVTKAADASCLGVFPLTTAMGSIGDTCRLGGTGCTDGSVAQSTTCQPAKICLPDNACTCNGLDLACLAGKAFTNQGTGKNVVIDCTVELDPGGNVCPTSMMLPGRVPAASTRNCTAPSFVALPLQQPLQFASDLSFPSSGARYVLGATDGTCKLDLVVHNGPTASVDPTISPDLGLVNFHPSNGFAVLIPIRISYVKADQCSPQSPGCTADTSNGNGELLCFADGALP